MIFSLLAGVRYDVGVDYLSYLRDYKLMALDLDQTLYSEVGFKWLTRFFALGRFHYAVYFGFLALIQLFFILYAFKDERYLYPFLVFVLLTDGTFFMWMNGIRQCIVICIFIFTLKYIHEKKPLKYFLWIATGFLIHRSALLLVPFYFILSGNRDFFKKVWVQLLLLFIAFFISNTNVWDHFIPQMQKAVMFFGYSGYEDIESHIESGNREFHRSIRFFFPLLINVIIVLFSPGMKSFFGKKFLIYYNIYFLGVLFSLIFFNNILLQRPVMYFIFSQFIVEAFFLYYLWNRISQDLKYLPLFLFLSVMYLGILFAYIQSDHSTMFRFFWESGSQGFI